jgi:hypothetical protein
VAPHSLRMQNVMHVFFRPRQTHAKDSFVKGMLKVKYTFICTCYTRGRAQGDPERECVQALPAVLERLTRCACGVPTLDADFKRWKGRGKDGEVPRGGANSTTSALSWLPRQPGYSDCHGSQDGRSNYNSTTVHSNVHTGKARIPRPRAPSPINKEWPQMPRP